MSFSSTRRAYCPVKRGPWSVLVRQIKPLAIQKTLPWISPYLKLEEGSSVSSESKMRTPRKTTLREQFIELIKKARRASPIEKLQIEVALSLVIGELLMDPAD